MSRYDVHGHGLNSVSAGLGALIYDGVFVKRAMPGWKRGGGDFLLGAVSYGIGSMAGERAISGSDTLGVAATGAVLSSLSGMGGRWGAEVATIGGMGVGAIIEGTGLAGYVPGASWINSWWGGAPPAAAAGGPK